MQVYDKVFFFYFYFLVYLSIHNVYLQEHDLSKRYMSKSDELKLWLLWNNWTYHRKFYTKYSERNF